MSKRVNVYIPEQIPSMNKGEEAIIRGILQGLKEEHIIADVTIFSAVPDIDRERFRDLKIVSGVTFRPMGQGQTKKIFEFANIWLKHILFVLAFRLLGGRCLALFKGEVWRAYYAADLILVGHDGVFSDANLPFAVFVKALGKKHAIFGMGFSGFRSLLAKKLARFIMPLFDLIVLREESVFNRLQSVGVEAKRMHVKPDPAFFLQPASDVELEDLLRREGLQTTEPPLIGMIAVRGSKIFDNCFSQTTDLQAKHAQHVELFARMVEHIIDITAGKVVFLPHCIGYTSDRDDRKVAKAIKYAVSKQYHDSLLLIENEYDAPTLKKLIERLDFLVAERTHALIGACSVGTPFLAVTVREDTRTHDIIGKTFAMEELLIDINEPDMDAIIALFKEKWNSRRDIKRELLDRAILVHKECRSAAEMLADLLRQ